MYKDMFKQYLPTFEKQVNMKPKHLKMEMSYEL